MALAVASGAAVAPGLRWDSRPVLPADGCTGSGAAASAASCRIGGAVAGRPTQPVDERRRMYCQLPGSLPSAHSRGRVPLNTSHRYGGSGFCTKPELLNCDFTGRPSKLRLTEAGPK